MKAFRAALGLGAGLAAYSLYEPRRLRLVRRRIVLGPGHPRLRILHVSDTHMKARDRALQGFLAALPEQVGAIPDLVLATGDLIETDEGIEPLVEAFGRLEARIGRYYVLGSHDYFLSRVHAYTKYFTGKRPVNTARADTVRLEEGLRSKGWGSLLNESETVEAGGTGRRGPVRITGVDDPYIKRHRTDHLGRKSGDALAIGLMHAPELVSEFALAGYDLVLAGHTHAGQVRLPGLGALVTNCSLPAGLAGGLHRVGETWLHVSPGLGQGRFAPIRFNCRPEATLLELDPATQSGADEETAIGPASSA